jgi:hypothetical protein
MKLYICGPMTGKPNNNFNAFYRAEKVLIALGYQVENPARIELPEGHEKTWENYMKADLPRLVQCDGIATLNGFESSRGAMLELQVASALGIEIHGIGKWIENTEVLP